MRFVQTTARFRKNLRKVIESGRFKRREIQDLVDTLARGEKLDEKYHDHQLTGEFSDYREFHLKFNLLVIYRLAGDSLALTNIGTHDDLFG